MSMDWPSLIGAVGGGVGAVTGIAGFVLSVVAYRRSNALVRTNTLHDVKLAHDEASRAVSALVELLPRALGSRKGVMSARGVLRSSMMDGFAKEHEADSVTAGSLRERVGALDPKQFGTMSYEVLMEQLTRLRSVQGETNALTQKYEACMASDARDRDHLREDQRAEMAARMSRPERL